MDEIELNQKPENNPDGQKPVNLKLPKKRVVWPWFVFLVLIILALLAYIGYKQYYLPKYAAKEDTTSDTLATEQSELDATPASSSDLSVDRIVDDGVTWSTPQKLDDQSLFTKNSDFDGMGEYTGTDYYLVGTTSSGAQIIVAKPNELPSANQIYRFLKQSGNYYLLTKNSSSPPIVGDAFQQGKYSSNNDFVLQSLLPDASITQGNTVLIYQFNGGIGANSDYTTGEKLMSTKWGDLYAETASAVDNSEGSVKIARYYILLNDGSRAYYSPKPVFLRDDNTFNVSWTDTVGASLVFNRLATSGCGSGLGSFPSVTSKDALSGKVSAAKFNSKDTIYHFTSASELLNKFGYAVYTMDGSTGKKSIDDFIANLGLVVWTDDFGSTIVYSNSKYVPAVECGKPVIYLYPTKDTEVSVKVAADITKSEPKYYSGWNVLASPTGQLLVDNKTYPNLFWEGTGLGLYPAIKSGLVVPTNSASSVIGLQLTAMGLNSQEIADFKEYWIPKLPDSPYVRLSWLTTSQMNQLAPIKVSPQPDSMLRVFLDFQGLNQPVAIAPQILPHFDRNGFSVVEWGGLLRTAK